MKHLISALILIFVGVVGWRIGGQLNSESLGMALGMLLGIMAGIPTALLVLASQRRDDERPRPPRFDVQAPAQIVNNYHKHLHFHGATDTRAVDIANAILPGPAPEIPEPRQFRIVGEHEEVEW